MLKDERMNYWAEAERLGAEGRRDGDPLWANPYEEAGAEAALHHCWRRGWMQADRELAAETEPLDRKLFAV